MQTTKSDKKRDQTKTLSRAAIPLKPERLKARELFKKGETSVRKASRYVFGDRWIVGALAACLATPAIAAGSEGGRYTMSPAEGGVIRLDRETGAMSFCTGKEGEWSCKDMPETETALKKRVEELEGEKRALEAEKRLREAPPGLGPLAKAPDASPLPPGAAPPPPPGDLPMPNEKDVDKLFDYVEGMVKKFKERIDRLEKEAKKEPDIPL